MRRRKYDLIKKIVIYLFNLPYHQLRNEFLLLVTFFLSIFFFITVIVIIRIRTILLAKLRKQIDI